MAKKGHNVKQVVEVGPLRSFVQRIIRLKEEKAKISDDEKVVYAEAKSAGYDPKYIKAAIKELSADQQKLIEYWEMVEIYVDAIGDLDGTPLGEAGRPH